MKRTIAVTVMCVAMMLMGAHVRADDEQSRCRRISQKFLDFWNLKDFSTAFNVFTEDIVYEDVSFGQVSRGGEEFKTFAEGFFTLLPQSTFTLVKSSCSGQHGSIEWLWSAVDDPGFFRTGDQFDVRGVSVIAIHGNRISHTRDYYDYSTVLRQLGQLQ